MTNIDSPRINDRQRIEFRPNVRVNFGRIPLSFNITPYAMLDKNSIISIIYNNIPDAFVCRSINDSNYFPDDDYYDEDESVNLDNISYYINENGEVCID